MSELIYYIETLKILQERKISFAVTGTFALYLQNRTFTEHYELKDCDIFLHYSSDNLTDFVTLMRSLHWIVTIWEQEVSIETLMQQAEGKYYIRCRKEELVLDATYEYEADKFGDMQKDLTYADSLPMINASKILDGKKYRGTERDLLAISVFKTL